MARGGPRTSSGKAISRHNATRHGVLAAIPVVPGLERREDWEAHRAGILASLSPEGHLENVLAERVALQLWRLHRVARYEALAITTSQETVERDVTAERRRCRLGDPSASAQLGSAEQQLTKQQDQLCRLRQFPGMPDDAPLSGEEADQIVWRVEKLISPIDRTSVSVPFMADDATIEDYPLWTAGKLRVLLAAMAAAAAREPAELLAAALDQEATELAKLEQNEAELALSAEKERAEIATQVQREQRERLLPSEPEREKVARYEAHLSRELYKAMHELEALQERRQGRLAPLARIDVAGIPENPKLRNELPP